MEISKEVITILDYLGEKLGVSIDWTSQNVMPYVQEFAQRYIKYDIASSALWLVVCLLIDITVIAISVKLYKTARKEHKDNGWRWDIDDTMLYVAPTFLIIIIPTVLMLCSINSIFRDIFIPELRLYELLKGMMK